MACSTNLTSTTLHYYKVKDITYDKSFNSTVIFTNGHTHFTTKDTDHINIGAIVGIDSHGSFWVKI